MSKLSIVWVLVGLTVVGFTMALTAQMIYVVNASLVSSAIYPLEYEFAFRWLIGVCIGLCGVIVMCVSTFIVYLCRVTIDGQLSNLGPFQREKFIGLLQQQRPTDNVTPMERQIETKKWENK